MLLRARTILNTALAARCGPSKWTVQLKIAGQVEAGTVWVNQHLYFAPNIPFAGAKNSGIGVEFAKEGLEEFTQIQVINIAK